MGIRHLDVGDASVLASGPEFIDGYHANWGRISSFGSARLLSFLERAGFDDDGFESFSSEDAADPVSVYSRVQSVPLGERIRSSISEHRQLYALGSHLRLRLLGRFAVLESLIVHKPDPKDPYDSITRQVKMKMKLLDRRFARPVKYGTFGISEPLDKVWTKLYSLRSTIAHGASPSFGKGSEFAFFHSLDNADRLVANAVRSVLRQVFEEPDLLADLRDC